MPGYVYPLGQGLPGSPLSINSGGTGASTPSEAAKNLQVLPLSGGTLTGNLTGTAATFEGIIPAVVDSTAQLGYIIDGYTTNAGAIQLTSAGGIRWQVYTQDNGFLVFNLPDYGSQPMNIGLPGLLINGSIFNNTSVNTLAGSASGHIYWSMPEQGSGYKKVVISVQSFDNVGSTTIVFPTAFTYTPGYYMSSGGTVTVTSVNTTQIVIPTSLGTSGIIIVEGI